MPVRSRGAQRAADGAPSTDWVARFDELAAREVRLSAAEFDELGLAAWFLGRHDACEQAWDAAHRAYLADGDEDAAIRCVFWLGFTLGEHGQPVKARAWVGRLMELCEPRAAAGGAEAAAVAATCHAVAAHASGDLAGAVDQGRRAVALAREARADDLEVLATMGLGRALLEQGDLVGGFACMDRVMLAIAAGGVGDRAAGPAYCAVIASCLERWDIERAASWTRDLSDWCDAQRGLEPFRGECAVHRAIVLGLGGEWLESEQVLAEVAAVERRPSTVELALYRLGELHRRSGRVDQAAEAFRGAAELGREVQPGLALLRRDTGDLASARAGVARALEAGVSPGQHAELLAAQVDLACEAHDLDLARRAAEQLRSLAELIGSTYLAALADRAAGTVLLAVGEPQQALPVLRRAWLAWRDLEDPYDGALTRLLLACAARALGDEDAAQLEFDAARSVLTTLGALPDLARLERLASVAADPASDAGLSRREVEVLRLVAAGASNRAVAARLFLSERTVARHVSNILAKLALPNRASATAFAYEHRIVVPD